MGRPPKAVVSPPSLAADASALGTQRNGTIADTIPDLREPVEIERDAATEAAQTARAVDLRQAAQLEAERVNVPYDVWITLSEAQRRAVMAQPLARKALNPNQLPAIAESRLTSITTQEAANALARGMEPDIAPGDRTSHVILYDPPVELMVNGELKKFHLVKDGVAAHSRIPRKALTKKLNQGYTATEVYERLPEPAFPCELNTSAVHGYAGRPCEYRGRTLAETELHMKRAHSTEYATRQEAQQREREELSLAMQREQLELVRAQRTAIAPKEPNSDE